MNFADLWGRIQKLLASEVETETVSRGKRFKAAYDSEYDEIIVTPLSTKVPRHISARDFRVVWEKSRRIEGDPYRPAYYQRESRNASYILTLIKTVLGEERPKLVVKEGIEQVSLLKLKGIKGSCRSIVKSSWSELEEKTERFLRGGRL